ncbi:lysis protein [Vibrio anguillarum]|uniref:lysis protein n=1 Tax=Vibrio anguillarum TaxID=55601 RepID=UPI00131CB4CD|nr:lysis protein [Vibrio anguillarum]MBT2925285.1 lysis protein [Vibrio anguillarum]MBT2944923.1 lysis protein [Vibrio anguillarum]MBT9979188.1 lysis protein [Vibrio anguillarum]MBT9988967.1 lysis protein [Vibrio anguillarum]MBU0012817.1 lysis protein [Vibrio anguillarum]
MKFITLAVLVILLIASSSLLYVKTVELDSANNKLSEANLKIDSYVKSQELQKQRIEMLAEIGDQSAKELKIAHDEINHLADQLRAGPMRVYVKASCPKPVSDSATTGSVGDAGAAQLDEAAREDYLHFRRMIVDNERQVKYLQSYIKTQCMVAQ